MVRLFAIFLTGLIITLEASAQGLVAEASRTEVATGARFQISFKADGKGSGFDPPSFHPFTNVRGPQIGQSSQVYFGPDGAKREEFYTYSYSLEAPGDPGTYLIGSASINIQGKEYKSEPIKIVVRKGESQDLKLHEYVFIRAIPEKSSVYKGEPVEVKFKLFTRLGINGFELEENPRFDGFWTEEIPMPDGKLQVNNETINGQNFKTAVLKRYLLFPQKSGKLNIEPLNLTLTVQVPNSNPGNRRRSLIEEFFGNDPFFNDPFGGRNRYNNVKHLVSTGQVELSVKDLPSGAPASFNGNVGDFDASIKVDKNTVALNEPLSVKINVSGTGNLKLLMHLN